MAVLLCCSCFHELSACRGACSNRLQTAFPTQAADIVVRDNANGTYNMSMTVPRAGTYDVMVVHNGLDVIPQTGSSITVHPGTRWRHASGVH